MANEPMKPNGGYIMHTFEDLKELFYAYIQNHADRAMIEKAYKFADSKHKGQLRKSGEPYIQHPIEVAYIIAQLQGGPATICAGFLHDVVEDTDTTVEQLEKEFSPDVAKIVDSLTKIQRMKLSHKTAEDFEAEDHRKIFLGMAKDVRVIIVKLADRLHNMRTISSLSPERQQALAKETLEVFTPIAHRLGIFTVQSELQDLSLHLLEKEKFEDIQKRLVEKNEHRQESLDALKKRIADMLFEHGIPFKMESRVKSVYSIYKKMYEKGHSFDDIYDVLAVRIITKTELNCYETLGLIHSTYKPIPGRFKDYIAMPKPNMYQSLHTSIISGDGQVYEVQIRTEEMDKIAETGIAAHWKYKEGDYNASNEQKEIEDKLHWFRDFVSMSATHEGSNAQDYIDSMTNDIFGANVYVFTPNGKVIELPADSSTLDFAYRIHTKVGDSAVGAVVNGVGVPLSTKLKTGDICEIRTAKNAPGPNVGWLSIVKTSSAKAQIRKAIQKKDSDFMRAENIKAGKASSIEAFRMHGIEASEMEKMLDQPRVLDEFRAKTLEDLYVAFCTKNPAPAAVIDFLNIKRKRNGDGVDITKMGLAQKVDPNEVSKEPVLVPGGITNLAISLGQCCNPIPGDEIVGYITKGKGITVHRHDCPNIKAQSHRLVDVYWNPELKGGSYNVAVEVFGSDRSNLVADILNALAQKGVGCSDLSAHLVPGTGNVGIAMNLRVPNGKVLQDTIALVLGIKGVHTMERVTK